MSQNIEQLIGNYQAFFADLNHRAKAIGINMHGMQMSHLLYRVREQSNFMIIL